MATALLELLHLRPRPLRLPFLTLIALARQRRQLREMAPETLADLGLDRRSAEAEARRPVWDVPNTWLK